MKLKVDINKVDCLIYKIDENHSLLLTQKNNELEITNLTHSENYYGNLLGYNKENVSVEKTDEETNPLCEETETSEEQLDEIEEKVKFLNEIYNSNPKLALAMKNQKKFKEIIDFCEKEDRVKVLKKQLKKKESLQDIQHPRPSYSDLYNELIKEVNDNEYEEKLCDCVKKVIDNEISKHQDITDDDYEHTKKLKEQVSETDSVKDIVDKAAKLNENRRYEKHKELADEIEEEVKKIKEKYPYDENKRRVDQALEKFNETLNGSYDFKKYYGAKVWEAGDKVLKQQENENNEPYSEDLTDNKERINDVISKDEKSVPNVIEVKQHYKDIMKKADEIEEKQKEDKPKIEHIGELNTKKRIYYKTKKDNEK